ncbi:uncharacterized protein [Oryza sativa Japonica Group]|uniref:uncharacterized protein n=1 Tax=Oryza sativa subsp. japonica TaxID=39947 RepID=UPI00339C797C
MTVDTIWFPLRTEKSALERLDGYQLRLRKNEEDLRHKDDKRRVVANALKKTNAENKTLTGEVKSLRAELETANKRDTEWERQLAAAEEKIKSLEARLVPAEAVASTMAPAAESAKQAYYTLRLALNDLGARAKGAPGDDGMAFDFSEWTQEGAGSVVEVASAYGDCCARVLVGFVLSLLHEHGCGHVENFSELVNGTGPKTPRSPERL